jgi:hypothetical protein
VVVPTLEEAADAFILANPGPTDTEISADAIAAALVISDNDTLVDDAVAAVASAQEAYDSTVADGYAGEQVADLAEEAAFAIYNPLLIARDAIVVKMGAAVNYVDHPTSALYLEAWLAAE